VNAISDVIQNRPRPLRQFDQIYMKAGDMVMQSEFVANWANGQRLAFVGDGDSISVCVAYLLARKIVDYGPSQIKVFDFDERVVSAINRFADRERLETLEAELYNCIDALPMPGNERDVVLEDLHSLGVGSGPDTSAMALELPVPFGPDIGESGITAALHALAR